MPHLTRDRVTWLIYAQLGVWGYVLYGFGPIVPLLRDEQGTSASVASLHGTGLAAGAAIGSALFPLATRRFGRGGTLWLALAGIAVTVIGLCLAHPLPATLIAATAISTFGTMVVGGVVTSLTAYCGSASPAAIAEANAVACGMGVLAPLVVGLAVGAGYGWRPGMAVAVGLVGLLALFARVRVPAGDPVSTVDRPGRLPRPYWVAWTLMTFTGSVEVCLSLWAGDVLRGRAGMTAGAAAAAISGIVGGMALGRLVGGWLSLRIDPIRLFLAVLTVSFIGFALFWTATASWLAVSGLVILGLGNAMHYPLGISMALRLAPGQEDQAAARATYGMVIGFGLAPFALGAIADALGVHTAFLLVPLFLAVAAVLVVRLAVPAPLPDYAR